MKRLIAGLFSTFVVFAVCSACLGYMKAQNSSVTLTATTNEAVFMTTEADAAGMARMFFVANPSGSLPVIGATIEASMAYGSGWFTYAEISGAINTGEASYKQVVFSADNVMFPYYRIRVKSAGKPGSGADAVCTPDATYYGSGY